MSSEGNGAFALSSRMKERFPAIEGCFKTYCLELRIGLDVLKSRSAEMSGRDKHQGQLIGTKSPLRLWLLGIEKELSFQPSPVGDEKNQCQDPPSINSSSCSAG